VLEFDVKVIEVGMPLTVILPLPLIGVVVGVADTAIGIAIAVINANAIKIPKIFFFN